MFSFCGKWREDAVAAVDTAFIVFYFGANLVGPELKGLFSAAERVSMWMIWWVRWKDG